MKFKLTDVAYRDVLAPKLHEKGIKTGRDAQVDMDTEAPASAPVLTGDVEKDLETILALAKDEGGVSANTETPVKSAPETPTPVMVTDAKTAMRAQIDEFEPRASTLQPGHTSSSRAPAPEVDTMPFSLLLSGSKT
jgi:hypothetical protein